MRGWAEQCPGPAQGDPPPAGCCCARAGTGAPLQESPSGEETSLPQKALGGHTEPVPPSSPLNQVEGKGKKWDRRKDSSLERFQHRYSHTHTHTHTHTHAHTLWFFSKGAHGSPSPKVTQGGSQAVWVCQNGRGRESIGSIRSYI